jgi:peptidoglycan/xylan/chitin deacetylase (PgdA/CDA1 family)
MHESDWEIASHGLRWIDHRGMSVDEERRCIEETIALHTDACAAPPAGWYMGRYSANTLDLLAERKLAYVSDSYADELPYWTQTASGSQLMMPYTLDANDMCFLTPQGFGLGAEFERYLVDSFDVLYRDGLEGRPRMMSIGLHNRVVGRPGRVAALARLLDHIGRHERIWLATRVAIAEHWRDRRGLT